MRYPTLHTELRKQPALHALAGDAQAQQQSRRGFRLVAQQAEEQVFGADVVVAEVQGLALCQLHGLLGTWAERQPTSR